MIVDRPGMLTTSLPTARLDMLTTCTACLCLLSVTVTLSQRAEYRNEGRATDRPSCYGPMRRWPTWGAGAFLVLVLSLGGVSPGTPAGMPHSCAWLKNAAVNRLPKVRTALAGLAGYAAGIYSHGTFLSWMRRLCVAAAARDARAPADGAGAGTETGEACEGTTHAKSQSCYDAETLPLADLEDDLVRLVLVRHGMSIWNKDNRFTPWMDVPLSRHGLDDAQRAGMLCRQAGMRFDMAFTSVLQRAVKTCHMILEEICQLWIPTVLQICLFFIIICLL